MTSLPDPDRNSYSGCPVRAASIFKLIVLYLYIIIFVSMVLFSIVDVNKLTPNSVAACPVTEHTCANGRCIGIYSICDGYNNCGDYSDERNCSKNHCVSSYCTIL